MTELKEVLTGKRIVTIIAVIVVFSTVFVTFFTLNGNSADFSHREVRVIITDSMDGEPRDEYEIKTIPKDSLVMVRLLSDSEKEDIQVGDVIQFRMGNILNHHRVIENNTEEGYVITQGDNTSSPDPKISYDRIRGEVVGVNHALGEIVHFVKTYVFVLLILIVVIFIASKLAQEMIRERKEKDGKL